MPVPLIVALPRRNAIKLKSNIVLFFPGVLVYISAPKNTLHYTLIRYNPFPEYTQS